MDKESLVSAAEGVDVRGPDSRQPKEIGEVIL